MTRSQGPGRRLLRAGNHYVELPYKRERKAPRAKLGRRGALHLRRCDEYIAEALAAGDDEQLTTWRRLREVVLARARP